MTIAGSTEISLHAYETRLRFALFPQLAEMPDEPDDALLASATSTTSSDHCAGSIPHLDNSLTKGPRGISPNICPTVEIPLGKSGLVAVIDESDADAVFAHAASWRLDRQANGTLLYARAGDGIYLHRLILEAPRGVHVDHVNGNGLINCRANLRLATSGQNLRNQRARTTSTSGMKGIYPRRGRWEAKIVLNYQPIRIGRFDTPEEAARAYDAKARELFGEFARLNFPHVGELSATCRDSGEGFA